MDTTLSARQMRMVYLITYSQVNENICASREDFAHKVTSAFGMSGAQVIQWTCCREYHQDGGTHYHMAIKLDKPRRWLKVRNSIDENHGIKVHFSATHSNYYTAWQYVTKEDPDAISSPGHPDLGQQPPTTAAASAARHGGPQSSSPAGPAKKRKRLTAFDVSEVVIKHNIKSRSQLLVLAERQKRDGKTDLAEFIVNRGTKCVAETIKVAWELHNSESALERENMSRLEILRSFTNRECVDGCYGAWQTMAEEILAHNDISPTGFKKAVFEALDKGRGKYRNILLIGPANCGKTFLLAPLTQVYETFSNPASTSFAWVGAEKAEVIFLNDFRWSTQIIPWHDLLLLLEGQLVHLPAPKTHFAQDLVLAGTTPVFATGKSNLVFIKGGELDEKETEMMAVRWRTFAFNWQIPVTEQREIPACGPCFSKFILNM